MADTGGNIVVSDGGIYQLDMAPDLPAREAFPDASMDGLQVSISCQKIEELDDLPEILKIIVEKTGKNIRHVFISDTSVDGAGCGTMQLETESDEPDCPREPFPVSNLNAVGNGAVIVFEDGSIDLAAGRHILSATSNACNQMPTATISALGYKVKYKSEKAEVGVRGTHLVDVTFYAFQGEACLEIGPQEVCVTTDQLAHIVQDEQGVKVTVHENVKSGQKDAGTWDNGPAMGIPREEQPPNNHGCETTPNSPNPAVGALLLTAFALAVVTKGRDK